MATDIKLQWTTTTSAGVATDNEVAANDPEEWPVGYPMFTRVIYINAANAAIYGCPQGWYEHIGESGTQVVLGQTLPVWIYKKMP